MEEEKEEKSINWLLIILDIIIGAIIILAINFITSVDKVYAMDYINYYNNNGILKRCEQTNNCTYNIPSYTGYEFGNAISLTTNINLTVRIQYTTEYYYKNWTINESGLYVFLRGSSIIPLNCNDSGNQSVSGSDWVTKRYNHNITCTLSILGTDSYELGLAMSVSQVHGSNYSAFVENTINITNFSITTTPNTSGIESAINSGNVNIINNNNQNTQNIIDNQNQNTNKIVGALEGTENIEDSRQSDSNVTAYENLDPLTINTNDLNYMEFSLDPNSNTWVWDRVTEFINLNSIITNMTITILAIGLIKLVLSR